MPSDHTDQPAYPDLQRKIEIVEAGLIDHVLQDSNVEYIVEPGWTQSISRNIPAPLSNRVSFSVLSEAEADERIEKTISLYQSLRLPLLWMVSPSSRPVDLPARLMARGFRLMARVRGMIGNVDTLVQMADHGESQEIHVDPVREVDLDEWIELIAEGWNMLPEARELMREKTYRRHAQNQDKIIYVLARCGAVACGGALVEFHREFGLLMSGFVKPEFRRRGVYRAMIKMRAKLLKERNIPFAVVHALDHTSAPLARAMGFEDVCEMVAYVLSWDNARSTGTQQKSKVG